MLSERKMASSSSSPISIENQIDSFLEQFKRNAFNRATDENYCCTSNSNRSSSSSVIVMGYNNNSRITDVPGMGRSRSGNLDLDEIPVEEAGELDLGFSSFL